MSRLQELVEQVKSDMDIAEVPYDFYVPIVPNSRLRTVAGKCKSRNGKAYIIEINGNMLKSESDEFLKNVICHELLHSAPECIGEHHGGMWKHYAQVMNYRNKNYNITRCYSSEDLCNTYKRDYKYKIVCLDCGKEYYYRTKSKAVLSIMRDSKSYSCGRCGKDNLIVVEL